MKHFIWIVMFIISQTVSLSQSTNSISENSIHDFVINQWTTKNGLVTNKITDIMQSNDGYIWLTTYDGILRFDGIKFKVFNMKNTSLMEQNTYYQILETNDSTIWFVSRGEGLLKYKNRKFSKHQRESQIPKSVRSIFFDSEKTLWIGSFDSLQHQIRQKFENVIFDGLAKPNVLCTAEDSNGNIYFGTDGDGVVKYDRTSFTSLTMDDGLVDNVIISISKGIKDDIIIGTFSGAMIIRNDKVINMPFTEGARINDILVDSNQNILLGTDLGLYRINAAKNIYEKLLEGKKLPSREVNTIDIDREGSIWLGMERGGVIQLKTGKLTSITGDTGLSLNRTNIIVQNNEHEFWVGSDNGDIDIVDKKNNTITKLQINTDLTNRGIRDILFDKNDTWIASYNGLLRLSNGKEKNYIEADGLSSKLIRRVIKDHEGNLIIATRSGGVNKMTPDGEIKVYDKKAGLKSNYILSLLEVGSDIYVGTNRGGISIIDKSGRISTIEDYGEKILDVVNFSIHSDKKGRLWVATSNGLFQIKNRKLKKVVLDDSLLAQAFFDVLNDDDGNFWISTSIGLVLLLEKDIMAFLDGKISFVNYKLYTDKDGLPSSECTAATRMLLDENNKLWIPTNNGIGVIDPDNISLNNIVPPTYVTKLMIDNEEFDISSNEDIHIPPGKIRYTIGFTALSYLAPENVTFQYQLEGVDKTWVSAQGMQREIQYTNIPPGPHTFRVKAANNDDVWNTKEATLTFTVDPFIYQTLWFYLLLVFFFITCFIFIYRWRLNQITKTNTELKRLNTELDSFVYSTSHDLRAPLASLLGLLNIAKIEKDAAKKDVYMKLMESSVNKLDDFISDIINYSRNSRLKIGHEDFDIKTLTEELLTDLQYLDPTNRINKTITLIGDSGITADSQRIKIILNNLISNSLKYFDFNKQECTLAITLNHTPDNLLILVEDNGIGIAEEHIALIFKMFHRATEHSKGSGIGLYIVKEAITKLNGTISVTSSANFGARFEVNIPLD